MNECNFDLISSFLDGGLILADYLNTIEILKAKFNEIQSRYGEGGLMKINKFNRIFII